MTLITLIPAVRATFIDDTISSLIMGQTRKPDRIILSDDHPDNAVLEHVRNRWPQVEVIAGPKRGCIENIRNAYRFADPDDDDLVHVQLDDDMVSMTFYAAHIAAHESTNIEASFSVWHYLHHDEYERLSQNDRTATATHGLMPGGEFIRSILTDCNNWAGPLTTMVFRASVVRDCLLPAKFRSSGISHYGLADIGTLLDCAERGLDR